MNIQRVIRSFINWKAFALITLAISSCKKPEEYPITPIISYKEMYTLQNAQGYDTKLYVTLNFTDGDGDVGYDDYGYNDPIFDDPNSPYYNNFKVKTFHYENGVLIQDTVDISARMENVTPETQNKTLKGEITRDLPLPPSLNNDTFHFEIFIYDRGLHASNTIVTPDIILKTR